MNSLIDFSSRFRILKGGKISLVVSAFLGGAIIANAAPSGGTVTSGNATINQSGNVTNINQSSQKASINWNDFSIKSNETVNFNQPNVNSITLNRVVGTEKSVIDGALNANGQVWILNSNGVLFNKNAKVNTSGLVATTAELSDADFQAGNYEFKNSSSNSVINVGTIEVSNSGSVVLASNEVQNSGTIKAVRGKVHLVGADSYSLNLNGNSLVNLTVNKGVLDALVKNSGNIIANGGEIYLTTNAVNELLKGVVNNTGVIEANSIDGITGKVELFAHGGTAEVSGTIEAKDGFVETSGKDFKVESTTKVKAKTWLIDPTNITVSDATAYKTALNAGTDTLIQTNNASGSDEGNIYINDTIDWTTTAKLTLDAYNNIYINKAITATNGGKLAFYYGQGAVASGNTADYFINAKVNLSAGDNFFTKKGNDASETTWKVINTLGYSSCPLIGDCTSTGLLEMGTNLSGNYVLGADINASETSTWNSSAGWTPIGNSTTPFTGNFDGLGHTVNALTINRPTENYIGLFGKSGSNSSISNIRLTNINFIGNQYVGGIIGFSYSKLSNVSASGNISFTKYAGGLVGTNYANIDKSYANINLLSSTNFSYVGGLVGANYSYITNSYASGLVNAVNYMGGLVGYQGGTATNSWYDNEANTGAMADSTTYGKTKVQIVAALSPLDAWTAGGGANVEGYSTATALTLPQLVTFYTSNGEILFAGGFGTEANPYTITNWTQLQNINNSNILTQNYYFKLLNDLNSSTSDYVNLASSTANSGAGWNPIGYQINNVDRAHAFTGIFDGLGHTISNLYINRSSTDNMGLFGYVDSSSISNVGILNVDITGYNGAGALVGYLYKNTSLENVYSTGIVKGNYGVGGIIGSTEYVNNVSSIKNSYSTATVQGTENVGGLIGNAYGINVENSYATGNISSTNLGYEYAIGGLIGYAGSSVLVKNSYATGNIIGYAYGYVGGLVGYNDNGIIENSYATGSVTGTSNVGGLVGLNWNTINNSYATGNVTGTNYVGGLTGYNRYTISNSYATGNITGTTNVGGLAGSSLNTIRDSYATGDVTGTSNIGGLLGQNQYAEIDNAYSIGKVTGTGANVRGLIGANIDPETIIAYYDKTVNTGMPDESSYGKTSNELKTLSTFSGWDIQTDSSIDKGTPFLAWQRNGNSYTKVWVIGIKVALTGGNTSNSGSSLTSTTNDINKVVTAIVNTSVLQTPKINVLLPQPIMMTTPTTAFNGERVNLVSRPMENQPTTLVSMSDLRANQNSNNPNGNSDIRVPVGDNSIIQLVNGGVLLPFGVDQQFFVVNNENNNI